MFSLLIIISEANEIFNTLIYWIYMYIDMLCIHDHFNFDFDYKFFFRHFISF